MVFESWLEPPEFDNPDCVCGCDAWDECVCDTEPCDGCNFSDCQCDFDEDK
jgi:hypothetical protein